MKGKFTLIKLFSKVHGYLYHVSRGRIAAASGPNLSFLLLTTIGKKSGKHRRVPLTAIPYRESYVVVASFGGSPVSPSWLTNIRHNPTVQIRIGPVVRTGLSAIIEPSDPLYDELWAKAVAIYKGYDKYKQATSREISLVILTPVSSQF